MFGKKLPAKATIIADEGYKFANNSGTHALQHETYIVEVHPEGEEPFRTEVTGWVSWPDMPQVGDEITVLHKAGSHKVELHLEGDPRFDWKLRAADKKSQAAARREELLNAPIVKDQPDKDG